MNNSSDRGGLEIEEVSYSKGLDGELAKILDDYNKVVGDIRNSRIIQIFKETDSSGSFEDIITHLINGGRVYIMIGFQYKGFVNTKSFDKVGLNEIIRKENEWLGDNDNIRIFISEDN
ncbi:hypothetical protein [Candidatus Absconditicoccus praedator]|uniref:hypothetical protein n=1 Tax=Candidatus Absconditicoccus praedator TaxID=2735562 RepID=UPI001E3B1B54|nr:hypothetical protein [Candidatus Absconditicoccus praedator]UFX82931.1 hypothetical protein HLG78_02245 [Candidatus Absconditicoccus praedator]